MSNKKRIRKRVQKIEQARFSRFIQKVEQSGKIAEAAAGCFIALIESIDNLTGALKRRVKVMGEHVLGYEFKYTEENPELDAFILDVRTLTGYEEEIVKILCGSLPEEHWETCKGLLIAGFPLKDALEEIVDTYRL